ncbi:MAG: CehA/McbA family metallohydrolase [Myxococcota bacterium]
MRTARIVVWVGAFAAVVVLGTACAKEGCLAGEPGCHVSPPCQKVSFQCASPGALSVKVIDNASERPGGSNALGAKGDVLLSNGTAVAVISALGNQNYLDPNGGSLLDLSVAGNGNDGINQVLQVVGILPRDAAHFTELEIIDERPQRVAVQVKGTLDGNPNHPVYTLYEMRPCDPGVRIRTELVNASTDPQAWALMDGWYWSKREPIPFTPHAGEGYTHPSFNLLTIDGVFHTFPFLAATIHSPPYSSYSEVSCTEKSISGFNSDVVSAVGLPKQVVRPRDYLVYERFIGVADKGDAEAGAQIAHEVRRQVLGETYVSLQGKVERPGAATLGERDVSILFSEGTLADPREARIPWTQVAPAADGSFTARVPAGKRYVLEAHSFGKKAVEKDLEVGSESVDVGVLTLPSTAEVSLIVLDVQTAQGIDAEIFVVPADEATKENTSGSFHGELGSCSPWLGPPPGASPACNRVLVRNGRTTAEIPAGRYHLYAFHGPFWTLARETIDLTPTAHTVLFSLRRLPLRPLGTVSADLHVHGSASFDSQIPDYDRVLSFSAADLEVIVATDHDVVYDYAQIVRQLGLQDRMSTVVGLESTGHIPWMRVPGNSFPLVIGHYNFWPLVYDPAKPRNGGPLDELIEPGELFDRVAPLFTGVSLIELNHPWADAEFGRDLGFPRALGLNLLEDLPSGDDGTRGGMYVRSPKGGMKNNDHHAQEVMNGSQNDLFLPYRAFWWYTLNQGQLRTGTANSDSHGLTDNTVGMPRNVVWADTQSGPSFDVDRFNTAVRGGEVLGTNGPIIEATLTDEESNARRPSLAVFRPKPGGAVRVRVSAAPWVPIEEIRFVVNGKVAKTLDASALSHPADPFGVTGLSRLDAEVPLSELLPTSGDAWISIEAGSRLPLYGDLGGPDDRPDGVPDTTDNNGDRVVDQADVGEGRSTGPLANPPVPTDETNPVYHFAQLTGGYPLAFTNPFVLDLDGNGRFDAPKSQGGK